MGTLQPQIILIGSISHDFIARYPGLFSPHLTPEKIDKLSVSFLVETMTESYGGIAANIAYSLSLLKTESIILTAVGKDIRSYLRRLRKLGVDTSHLVVDKHLPTSTFFATTDQENHQICTFVSGAMAKAADISLSEWKGTNSLVVVSAHDPRAMAKHVAESQKYGLRLIYDPSQQTTTVPAKDLIAGVKAATILMSNQFELSQIITRTGLTEPEINGIVPITVTTLGANGSLIHGRTVPLPLHIPAVIPRTVVDPTGAGDAYRAGFLYGYTRGFDLTVCGQLGSVAASFAIEHHGTQGHHFTKKQFLARYKKAFKQNFSLD